MFHTLAFPSIRIVLFDKTHLNHATWPQLSFKCQKRNGFAVERYCVCVRQKLKFMMVSAKAKGAQLESFPQKFRSEWLLDEKYEK